MAGEKKKRQVKNKKKPAKGRRKFSTPEQIRAQLEGITAAQERYRRAKRRKTSDEIDATGIATADIIIDSREKSEQAWKNALRSIRKPEDLDGFD